MIIFITENYKLKLTGLAFKEFNLNHFNMFFIARVKCSLILERSFPLEYIVLSSAKLQITDFSTGKKISSMSILNNNVPNDPSCQSLSAISEVA